MIITTYNVGSDGFEPPKLEAADLQSAPFGHSGNYPRALKASAKVIKNCEMPNFYYTFFIKIYKKTTYNHSFVSILYAIAIHHTE